MHILLLTDKLLIGLQSARYCA